MFRYQIGTVRLFSTQENLKLIQTAMTGTFPVTLTDDYLQFVCPKQQIAEYKEGLQSLCDEGEILGAVIYQGVSYGEACEDIIFSWDKDDWHIVRDSLKNYGFVAEYYRYKDSDEYHTDKRNRDIRKINNYLVRLHEKMKVNV